MSVGEDGAVIVADARGEQRAPEWGTVTHVIKVRVEDVHAQFERERSYGARVIEAPPEQIYGECECTVEDLGAIAGSSRRPSGTWLPRSTGARRSIRGTTADGVTNPDGAAAAG